MKPTTKDDLTFKTDTQEELTLESSAKEEGDGDSKPSEMKSSVSEKREGKPSGLGDMPSFTSRQKSQSVTIPRPAVKVVSSPESEDKAPAHTPEPSRYSSTPAPVFSASDARSTTQIPRNPSNNITVIAPGTKIIGDIETDGGLCINGSVRGNIAVASTLELNGQVVGDIQAENIKIETSIIKGNVTARNLANVDRETIIVGDVTAQNAEIDGKIRGNLTVQERAHIQTDSVLVGNLISGTANIEEGAVLKGDISITKVHDDNVSIDDPDFNI